MIIDAKKISAAIREKKKKMLSAEPELVDTDANVDLDPVEHMDLDRDAMISETLGTKDPIDARNTMLDQSEHDAETMGQTSDEKKRQERLKKMLDVMDL